MKKEQKIALVVVFSFLVAGVWHSANALTAEEREMKKAELQTRKEEAKARLDEKKEENKARIEEKKEELKEKKQERVQERMERRYEHFQKVAAHINGKIENVLEKLETAGIDTSSIETLVSELKSKQDAVGEAVKTLDETMESEDKEAIKTARENVKLAVEETRNYYKETLRPAIKTLVEEARAEETEE